MNAVIDVMNLRDGTFVKVLEENMEENMADK